MNDMNDLIRREDVLTIFDTALESGEFRGLYDTYEKITVAIRKDIPSVGKEKCRLYNERDARIQRLTDCGYIYKRISKHWFLVRKYATPNKLLYHLIFPKYIK